jgi:hypothetical protein
MRSMVSLRLAAEETTNYSEYFAEPRKLRTPSESVLCTPEDRFSNILTFQGIDGDYGAIIPRLLNDTFYPFQCS